MNGLDMFIAFCVALPAAWGLWRGLVRGVTGPVAFLGAAAAGFALSVPVGAALMGEQPLASAVGFAAVALGVYLGVQSIGWVLRRAVAWAGLTWADHLLGGAAAAATGALVAAWMAVGMGCYLPGPPSFVRGSELMPYAVRLASEAGLQCSRLDAGGA